MSNRPPGRTRCPRCRGKGLEKVPGTLTWIRCEYCLGRRDVTFEDARVYLEVAAELRGAEERKGR